MSVAEWVDTYGIHHWRIIWSSYRKLTWVEFEPATTEFLSEHIYVYTYSVSTRQVSSLVHFHGSSMTALATFLGVHMGMQRWWCSREAYSRWGRFLARQSDITFWCWGDAGISRRQPQCNCYKERRGVCVGCLSGKGSSHSRFPYF